MDVPILPRDVKKAIDLLEAAPGGERSIDELRQGVRCCASHSTEAFPTLPRPNTEPTAA